MNETINLTFSEFYAYMSKISTLLLEL